jgi:glycosyltransferase involved in cell wall biosynthesis
LRIALDATYSLGRDLSGVGIYSRELLYGLAAADPDVDWRWLYRPHRFARSLREKLPANAHRGLLLDGVGPRSAALFHGLNQRLPTRRFARQVATLHDLFVMSADYSTPEFRARFTAQARHAAAEADRIIAVSQFTAKQVTELLGVEPARVTVIPHGVRQFPPPVPPVPREKIVLHVGAIQKRKNLVRLVRAFESVSEDWRLVLAGSSGYGAEEVFAAIAKSSASARITVTGYVDSRELAQWYARAMVFAFPSLDEGFGMPVLEAMASGVPVIASRGSAVGEVAGDGALLVDPLSEDQLREHLTTITTNVELRRQLIIEGQQRAAGYSWVDAARRTLAVYRELIGD